jgi:hypothetical protein
VERALFEVSTGLFEFKEVLGNDRLFSKLIWGFSRSNQPVDFLQGFREEIHFLNLGLK